MTNFNQDGLIHKDIVDNVQAKLPNEDTMYDLAELFKVFGDSSRIKILSCLQIQSLCVCDIVEALNMTVSAISHQLRILRQAKLVKANKIGKEVYYSLDDDHVYKIFECGLSHINE